MERNSVLAFVFLIFCSIFDLKNKKIPVILVMFFAGIGMICYFFAEGKSMMSVLLSLLPGAALLALGHCTRESIGYGDGFIVLVLGLFIGFSRCAASVIAGFFISAMFAIVLLLMKKVNGKSRIPYAPFLAAGLGVALWIST